MLRVFVGFDPRETVAFHVLAHSLHVGASRPVSVVPIMLEQLRPSFDRPREKLQSTDFSFSRFLTPWLSGYEGWSLFMDCDMLARDDVAKLFQLADPRYAVLCVKHNHIPRENVKFLGQIQSKYAKKNWSSVMLFNNKRCQTLTPEYVQKASGLDLHQFKWLASDDEIGELPPRWNHLVGVQEWETNAGIVHFTVGGPYFAEYRNCDYADEWLAARDSMLRCDQRRS